MRMLSFSHLPKFSGKTAQPFSSPPPPPPPPNNAGQNASVGHIETHFYATRQLLYFSPLWPHLKVTISISQYCPRAMRTTLTDCVYFCLKSKVKRKCVLYS